MHEGKRRAEASQAFAWLSALFKAAFADRPAILPSTFVACNLGIGLLLGLAAVFVWLNPQLGSVRSALTLAGIGALLSAGIVISRLRPAALARTLALHGALLALVAVGLALSALKWALWTRVPGSFRYMPGVILVLCVYGGLQVAEFGYWRASSRRIRLAGVCFGVLLELGVLAGFVVHLTLKP